MRAALAAALVIGSLAACGEAPPHTEPSKGTLVVDAGSANGTGTVAAVDAAAGTVTIAHGPMPEIGWSAMTMTFAADPALLAGIAEGDKVAFDLRVVHNAGTIAALSKQ